MSAFLRPVMALFFVYTIASSSFASVVADQAANVGIQRSFVNLDFSQPTITPQFTQLSQDLIPGWRTTHRFWGNTGRIIEIWRGAGHESSGGMPNATNDQYAELNAEEAAALYQKVCLFRNESFSWSFQHAARTTSTETAEFLIGTVADQVAGNATYAVTSVQSIATSSVTRSQQGRWVTRSGTATVSSNVPEKGGVYSFIFRATNGSTLGNFLDNIVLKLKPAVEFTTDNGQYIENNKNKLPVAFKIVGQINKASDMPKLNFNITHNSTTGMAKRPVYGRDYRLYRRVGENYIELSSVDGLTIDSNHNVSFSYTPDYKANLDYTQGVEINGLVIELFDNDKIEGDKTLPFSFKLDSSSQAIIASMKSCSQGTANYNFDFIIKDNDTDLKIIKTTVDPLTNQPTTRMFYPNERISYHFDLINKTALPANNVSLHDRLISNLIADANTTLHCESLTEKSTCPKLPKDAVQQLLTNTLNLGNIDSESHLRFHLYNLKTTAQDQSIPEYVASIQNQVSVLTEFNDIYLEDNTSVVSNRYAAGSDLFNLDTRQSGTGLMIVQDNGRALWQQFADNGFAYFPLGIKNSSQMSQDYQLYASRRELEHQILTEGGYSSLIPNSVVPYNEQLNIEFYDATTEQCKSDLLASSKAINQVSVGPLSEKVVCAVVQIRSSAQASHPIWFAISSLQFGLTDIVKNEVVSSHTQHRLLELINDQNAQIDIGGTYVFNHRLFNRGQIDENDLDIQLVPQENNGFLYSLFIDTNHNGVLDTEDTAIKEHRISLAKSTELTILLKVEAPITSVHGTRSQVQLIVIPNNHNQTNALGALANTDTIIVSTSPIKVIKRQFKVENCSIFSKSQVFEAPFSAANTLIKPQDCLIYQIEVKNLGSKVLYNISLNDSYPAYTQPWYSGDILPMSNVPAKIKHNDKAVQVTFEELQPNEQKSMFFGIQVH